MKALTRGLPCVTAPDDSLHLAPKLLTLIRQQQQQQQQQTSPASNIPQAPSGREALVFVFVFVFVLLWLQGSPGASESAGLFSLAADGPFRGFRFAA